jgi:hypothetical protein
MVRTFPPTRHYCREQWAIILGLVHSGPHYRPDFSRIILLADLQGLIRHASDALVHGQNSISKVGNMSLWKTLTTINGNSLLGLILKLFYGVPNMSDAMLKDIIKGKKKAPEFIKILAAKEGKKRSLNL